MWEILFLSDEKYLYLNSLNCAFSGSKRVKNTGGERLQQGNWYKDEGRQ